MVKKKLLIIEDDHSFSTILIRRLEKHQLICQLAENTSEALLKCKSFQPDAILLDMYLDGESGLTLIPLLKASRPAVKIILLTGYASIATAVQAMKLGADDYLAKPVDTQTLLITLNGEKQTDIELNQEPVLSPEQVEWEHINQVLKVNDGNISAAARQLSMHRRTLQRKLKKRPSLAFVNKDQD
ncbi:response regulator transcription factor [Colwellia sp. MEBiC06753]